jgi:hypothetical protein
MENHKNMRGKSNKFNTFNIGVHNNLANHTQNAAFRGRKNASIRVQNTQKPGI